MPTAAAPGQPFDHGLFDIVIEDLGTAEPRLVAITRAAKPLAAVSG